MQTRSSLNASEVRETALRLLARREHSIHELRQKLLARGATIELVSVTLDELISKDYLSDNRFAESAVRARLRTNDGPLKVRAYLSQKGIIDTLIKRYLPSDEELWLERAVKLDQLNCEKRGLSPPELKTHESWSLRSRLLKSRGYPAHIIRQVLESQPKQTL